MSKDPFDKMERRFGIWAGVVSLFGIAWLIFMVWVIYTLVSWLVTK